MSENYHYENLKHTKRNLILFHSSARCSVITWQFEYVMQENISHDFH